MDDAIVEMYVQFRRLKGYPPLPTSGINRMIDDSTGLTDQSMREFATFFRTEVLTRLPPSAHTERG